MKPLAAGVRASAGLALSAGAALLWAGRSGAAVVLTLSYLAAIISGLWLEHVLVRVLQPGRPRLARSLIWQAMGRMGFLAGFLALLFVFRRQVELWAVAAGWTVALAGWFWAGVRGT